MNIPGADTVPNDLRTSIEVLDPRLPWRSDRLAKVASAGLTAASLFAVLPAHGAITPYSWLRCGEAGPMSDSSGNNKNFNAAFSSGCDGGVGGGGQAASLVLPTGAGGPLGGPAGVVSAVSTRWGAFNCGNSGMWIQGPGNSVPSPDQWGLPPVNWVMEAWVHPMGTGAARGGNNAQFVSTGSGQFGGTAGGAAFRTEYNAGDNTITIKAESLGDGAGPIGDATVTAPGRWLHVAVVNDNGSTTFYVNGVASGDPSETVSPPGGVPYIGSGQDTGASFDGYLDEIRFSTFLPGQFQTSDLLTRPAGPSILAQPASASVWEGGAAPFEVQAALDSGLTYQWKLDNAVIAGATDSEYFLPAVTSVDSGKVYSAVLSSGGVDVTSSNATLTVTPVQSANVAYYRAAVEAEASLLAYFPVDGNTGTTVTNSKDPARNGTLQTGASYDGRTTRSYGQRALRFKGDSEVQVPANPAFEFTGGTGGTIEAVIYLARGAVPANETIFSLASGTASAYYQFQASPDGSSLLYKNDSLPNALSWQVSESLLGRRAHVALVFGADNTVTAYADGVSLGSKSHPSFGFSPGLPAVIGSSGSLEQGWNGTIDELAVYGSALSANTIAIHNSRFLFGTAVAAPVIETQPTGTWNLLAGGAPVFKVKANGTAPLTYQWKLNGVAVANNPTATTATLVLNNSTVAMSGGYTVTVTNPVGDDTSDPFTVNFTPAQDIYASFVLNDNPSAYWRLNETSGTVARDSAGGLNGTYATTVDRGADGALGLPDASAHFAGTGAPIPNVIVPYTPILNPTTPYTIEFWAKPDVAGTTQGAILATQNRATGRAGYAVYQGFNPGVGWEAHLGYLETVLFIQGQTLPEAGQWYHVAVTWDGVNTSRLYVNGIDDTNPGSTVNGPHRPNLSQPLEIGTRYNGTQPYKGNIDEVAFYNHLLTPEQIAQHASLQMPRINAPVYSNGQVTLTWTGRGPFILQESDNLQSWAPTPGNPASPYTTTVTGRKYYRLAQ